MKKIVITVVALMVIIGGLSIWGSTWRFSLAVDSDGMYCGGKYFVRKGATKNKEKVLARIQQEIDSLKWSLEKKIMDYEKVQNDEVNINFV